MMGDKRWDQVPAIGRALAQQGIGAVGVNYRLSPAVQHPEHIRNVAEAFAWVHQHIGEYGGRADKIAVMGHSAGGHLVALLATDDKYLKAHGLSRDNILAVIGISGVYQLSEMALNALGQRRRPNADGTPPPPLFEQIFGKQPDVAKEASPLSFVRSGLPPFLLIYAERDLPTLALQAMALHSALRAQKVDSNLLKVDGRNHGTVMWQASKPGDPVLAATVELIRKAARQAAAEMR
jgi:acetyl esterase/lipase